MEQPERRVVCDHKPLQECLLKNNNDRSKCLKEWNDFQQQCKEKKLQAGQSTKQDCEACKQ
ncbi:hypothetical protein BCR43DRAFT_449830 [Syncephalastrum racemosum]|uniref:Cysteine alpha-hairpin motif superfamily n=1 Tax=Syncephalastrum racemosum TaxID=13706 RepID=A0A1X2HTE3_SYNRA|nr:hypothetical protein BCR43DRAFT_449830 [Syncephalastrum racemosum]